MIRGEAPSGAWGRGRCTCCTYFQHLSIELCTTCRRPGKSSESRGCEKGSCAQHGSAGQQPPPALVVQSRRDSWWEALESCLCQAPPADLSSPPTRSLLWASTLVLWRPSVGRRHGGPPATQVRRHRGRQGRRARDPDHWGTDAASSDGEISELMQGPLTESVTSFPKTRRASFAAAGPSHVRNSCGAFPALVARSNRSGKVWFRLDEPRPDRLLCLPF